MKGWGRGEGVGRWEGGGGEGGGWEVSPILGTIIQFSGPFLEWRIKNAAIPFRRLLKGGKKRMKRQTASADEKSKAERG